MAQTAEQLAQEYMRLGGRRRAVIDDNQISTRSWEHDSPEAQAFWESEIDPLDADQRNAVETLLPSINRR